MVGTKTEMQRLINDANKVKKANGEMANLSIESFADITEAIHIIQTEMGITGTTALEASTTIQGSLGSMKSAWTNLLTGLANGNADLGGLVNNLMDSVLTVTKNIIPVIEQVIKSIPDVLPEVIAEIGKNIPQLMQTGVSMAQELINGLKECFFNNDSGMGIIAVASSVIENLINGIITLLPDIIQAGIDIILGLVSGISESLPDLIPAIVEAVITITETLIENIDMLIDAGIQLILGLADGLIEALPILIEKIPEIIEKLINAIVDNLPKIIEAGITVIIKLAEGLIEAIPQLVSKIPQIINSIVEGLGQGLFKIWEVGQNLVQGLWDGISNAKDWVLNKIKGFGQSILDGIKGFFGIHSPSTLFRDQIGKNLALGIGEGFTNEMKDITKDMQNTIPTKFDTKLSFSKGIINSSDNISWFKTAFVEAFREFKPVVILNGKEIGEYAFEYGNIKYGKYYD